MGRETLEKSRDIANKVMWVTIGVSLLALVPLVPAASVRFQQSSTQPTPQSGQMISTPTYQPGEIQPIQGTVFGDGMFELENCGGYPAEINCDQGVCRAERTVPLTEKWKGMWVTKRNIPADGVDELCTQ